MNFMDYWPLIAFVIIQTMGALYWAGRNQTRIEQLEQEVERLNADIENYADGGKGHGERMANIEGSIKNIETSLGYLKMLMPKRRGG